MILSIGGTLEPVDSGERTASWQLLAGADEATLKEVALSLDAVAASTVSCSTDCQVASGLMIISPRRGAPSVLSPKALKRTYANENTMNVLKININL